MPAQKAGGLLSGQGVFVEPDPSRVIRDGSGSFFSNRSTT